MSGRFSSIPRGAFDGEGRFELSGLFAPLPRLQLGVFLPFILNTRKSGGDFATGGGLSDVSASARFDLVPLSTADSLPGIALTTVVSLPTGASMMDAKDPLAVSATGLGAAEIRPGLFVEKSFDGSASAVFAASVGFRTPMTEASGKPVELGPRMRLVFAAGPVFENGLSLSAGLVHEHEWAPSIDGRVTPNADRRRTAALLFAGYDFGVRWTALGSFELDLPIGSIGKNEPAAAALSVGLRRAFGKE